MGLRVGFNLLINQKNEKVTCCFIGGTLSTYGGRLQGLMQLQTSSLRKRGSGTDHKISHFQLFERIGLIQS